MGTLQATRILLRVEWRRFGRWNEFCCSHDPKFRRRWLLMAILGAVLALFFVLRRRHRLWAAVVGVWGPGARLPVYRSRAGIDRV